MTIAERWQNADKSQVLKWTVYSLLLLNWGYYAVEEAYIASHTLRNGGTFLEWTQAFATTIDEFAWFGLLFMLELETYALQDEAFESKPLIWSIHGMRLVCYIFLAHTVFARATTLIDTEAVVPATEISSLCQLTDQDISFGENYRYELIDSNNCKTISTDTTFYYLDPTVVTDTDGYALERKHVLVDMIDASVWLLVIWAIELAVWLQNKNISGGRLMTVSHAGRFFYAILFMDAAWWLWTGHWVYAWDQMLWICGFWAIESNLSEWRQDIDQEQQVALDA